MLCRIVPRPPENYSDLLTGKVKCWFEAMSLFAEFVKLV